jgi:hypothetical protein
MVVLYSICGIIYTEIRAHNCSIRIRIQAFAKMYRRCGSSQPKHIKTLTRLKYKNYFVEPGPMHVP